MWHKLFFTILGTDIWAKEIKENDKKCAQLLLMLKELLMSYTTTNPRFHSDFATSFLLLKCNALNFYCSIYMVINSVVC